MFLLLLTVSALQRQETTGLSVYGVVVNTQTGQPIEGARVSVSQFGSGPDFKDLSKSAMTGTDGSFRITELHPGVLNIVPYKPGFFFENAGEPRVLRDRESKASLSLSPLSILSGHVKDSNGDVVVGAQVHLLRKHVEDGFTAYREFGTLVTDDRGFFHTRTQPGVYYLRTTDVTGGKYLFADAPSPTYRIREAFAPTYPSGALDLRAATPLILASGDDLVADITVTMQPAFEVQGALENFARGGATQIEVFRNGDVLPRPRVAYNATTGRFAIEDLPPGTYVIRATQGSAARGGTNVTLGSADINGILIPLSPAVNIPVNISALNEPPLTDEQIARGIVKHASDTVPVGNQGPACKVTLREAASMSPAFAGTVANIEARTIAVENVLPGEYFPLIDCDAGYLVSAAWGGIDLLASARIIVRPGAQPPIDIALRFGGGGLTVMIADPSASAQHVQTPGDVKGGGVILVQRFSALSSPRASGLSATSRKRPDGTGNELAARFINLAPGDYTAFAFSELSELPFRDAGFISGLSGGVDVHIEEQTTKEIEISKVVR